MKGSSGAVWCDAHSFSAAQISQWLLPSQANLLLKVEILFHQTVHLCPHSVLQNVHLALTSQETENSKFCWQTFTINNDSERPGMKVTFLLLVFALWPRSHFQPGRQRRNWPQPDHSQRHQHKPRFYRSSSAGPHNSVHGISFGHPVPESMMGIMQLSLSGPSFPESSSLGSVTASSLVLSRDHNRRLQHSQGSS